MTDAAALICDELRVLRSILDTSNRQRVYRHHLFYRRARVVLAASAKMCDEGQQESHIEKMKWTLVCCGVEASNEVRCHRIDTLPLAWAIIGCCARLHWLFQQPSHRRIPVVSVPSNVDHPEGSNALKSSFSSIGKLMEEAAACNLGNQEISKKRRRSV